MFKVSLRSVWVPLAILGVAATCAGQAALGSPRAESSEAPVATAEALHTTASGSANTGKEAERRGDFLVSVPELGVEAEAAEVGNGAAELSAEVEVASAPLRRLLKRETTRTVAKAARRIIDAHAKDAVGTEISFDADGERYVARIERHYHPPGGEKKPWGEHAGVSVFVARPWPDDVKSGATR